MLSAPAEDPVLRLKRIRYRASRRGFREAEIVLADFADAACAGLDPEELDAFERLLDENDHALYGWIVGREPPPAGQDGRLLEKLRLRLCDVHRSLQRGE